MTIETQCTICFIGLCVVAVIGIVLYDLLFGSEGIGVYLVYVGSVLALASVPLLILPACMIG